MRRRYDGTALGRQELDGEIIEDYAGALWRRDWIEAIGAYYRDHDKTPVNARLAAYTQAMEQMTMNRVRHLPVVEGATLVGIISIGDLVNWIISTQTSALNQLASYITGSP